MCAAIDGDIIIIIVIHVIIIVIINIVDIRIILAGTKSHARTLSVLKESVWRSNSRLHDVPRDSNKGQRLKIYAD